MAVHVRPVLLMLRRCIAVATVVVAVHFLAPAGAAERPERPPAESGSLADQIDGLIDEARELPVAAPADDAEFLRRLYLDLIGTIPPAEETRAFLDDPSTDKRTRLVDRLLASPQHARRMQVWLDVTLMERRGDTHVPSAEWQEYLRRAVLQHSPLHALVPELLAADDTDPARRPASKFYLDRGGELNLLVRDVSRLFLGRDLQCAQCHDHPLVGDYEQQHYYGLLAYLSRSFVFSADNQPTVFAEKGVSDPVKFQSVFSPDDTYETLPRVLESEPPAEPQFPGGQEHVVAPADGVRPIPKYSRREQFARDLACADNRAFALNWANRLWALMMGRGLVDPVDFHHSDNPPSHPELLDLLADELVASGFDMRHLMRSIASSATYGRSSALPDGIDPKTLVPEQYASGPLKPLTPEQLCFSLLEATGIAAAHRAAVQQELTTGDPRLGELLAVDSARERLADEVAEQRVYSRLQGNLGAFISLFGAPGGSPQNNVQSTVHQALFLSNGGPLVGWLAPGSSQLVDRLAKLSDADAIAHELYLSALSRPPNDLERGQVAGFLAARAEELAKAVSELAWALCTSSEFRFNH